MAKLRKSWREKLADSKDLPKVVEITGNMSKRWGTGSIVIPAPIEVDEIMKNVPRGKLITVNQIRETVAKKHRATIGCPLTTGIFIRIAAETAEEDLGRGEKQITPYWRVIKSDGSLNEKFPGGVEAQAAHLEKEGHTIEPGKGKKPPKVKDFEKALVEV